MKPSTQKALSRTRDLRCPNGGPLLFGFAGLCFLASGFAALDDAVENLVGFVLQIVLVNEAVKTFDFGALAKFFGRGRKAVTLYEID